ncbi:hypothetical protein [Promicromonospora iranensis]|uniref:hypothetical protein n=1 Tax=Promicromonospora iranensis TaxID=1105144 RepID=UPI0023A916F5|nr:hypothetical protein [Promicromonospora iranensis]
MSEPVTTPTGPAQPADPASSADTPRRRGPRRAVRRGTEREAVLGVSADERPAGWGEGSDGAGSADSGHGSNDDQLRRDVPPHWG